MSNGPAIDVRDVRKSFDGVGIVRGVDLRVEQGEIFGFLGPNGSGKTTFLRTLCGLLKADGGEGTCLGMDFLTRSAEIKCRVGYMTQRFSLYEDLTVEENLGFVARAHGLADPGRAVNDSLHAHGLEARRGQPAGKLSGGWKQRLALAASLLHAPGLLLLDEPTAGVDPGTRRDFWDSLHRLAAGGLTVLVTTHYMDEAERCHRIAYYSGGRILTRGTVPGVIADAGLHTRAISGPGLDDLAAKIRAAADSPVEVAAFGNELHASAEDPGALDALLRKTCGPGQTVREVPASLEDVFIFLSARRAGP